MKKTIAAVLSIVSITYFYPIFVNGSLLIYWGDELEQLLPHYYHLVTLIQNGQLGFWDSSLGLGSNVFSHAFISLASPLLWLLSIFPSQWLPYLLVYLDIIRFTLTAVFTYKWISHLVKTEKARFVATLTMTFSGYIMCWIHYGPFFDPIVMFSVLLYLSEEVLNRRKRTWFSFAVMMTIFVNPYYFYMFSWFLFFYMTYRVLSQRSENKFKFYFQELLHFLIYYLLGIGLSAFLFFPVLFIMSTSPRLNGMQWSDFIPLLNKQDLFAMITSFFSPVINDYDYNLFYSMFAQQVPVARAYVYSFIAFVFSVFPLLRSKFEGKKAFLIFAGFVYSLLLFPIAYKIFNGNTDVRWTFMIVIVNVIFVALSFEHSVNLKKKDWIFNAIALSVILLLLYYFSLSRSYSFVEFSKVFKNHIIISLCLILIYTITQIFRLRKWAYIIFILLVGFEGVYSIQSRMYINQAPRFVLKNDGVNLNSLLSNKNIESIQISDTGFYRFDVQNALSTDAIAKSYPGFTMYSSVYNHETQAFYNNRFTPFRKLWYQSSKTLIKSLLSSKYFISDNGVFPYGYDKQSDDVGVNRLDVGLGFATDVKFDYSSHIGNNAFLQDVWMFSGIFTESNNKSENIINPILLGEELVNGSIDIDSSLRGYVVIDYSRSNPYTQCQVDYSSNGSYSGTQSRNEYGYTTVPVENQVTKMYFYCSNEYNSSEFTPVDVYLVTESWIDELYSKVETNDRFYETQVGKDFIKSRIDITKNDSLAFTTIPYDKGWKVYVDGKEVKIKKVNISFIGFDLDKGSHHVELRFWPVGLTLGIWTSVISIIALIMLGLKKKLINSFSQKFLFKLK